MFNTTFVQVFKGNYACYLQLVEIRKQAQYAHELVVYAHKGLEMTDKKLINTKIRKKFQINCKFYGFFNDGRTLLQKALPHLIFQRKQIRLNWTVTDRE